jgi:hypothetical protein
MERWGGANHPLVKAVAGFSVPLFLALNFPIIFLAILAGMLLYAIGLLGVVHAYRRRYRIVGRPELALELAAKSFSNTIQTMTRGLANHQNRKRLQQERKARLSQYRRERNRRKRQQAREALVDQE